MRTPSSWLAMGGATAAAFIACAATSSAPPLRSAPVVPEMATASSTSATAVGATSSDPFVGVEPPPVADDDPGPPLSTPAEKSAALGAAVVSLANLTMGNVKVAGPCYQPKRHAAIVDGFAGTKGNLGFPIDDMSLHIDLDGDGVADDLLFMGATDITSRYQVYLRRGDCGYHLGSIETDASLSATKKKAHGLFELEGAQVCRKHCPETVMKRYAFDGKKFVLTKTWKA